MGMCSIFPSFGVFWEFFWASVLVGGEEQALHTPFSFGVRL